MGTVKRLIRGLAFDATTDMLLSISNLVGSRGTETYKWYQPGELVLRTAKPSIARLEKP